MFPWLAIFWYRPGGGVFTGFADNTFHDPGVVDVFQGLGAFSPMALPSPGIWSFLAKVATTPCYTSKGQDVICLYDELELCIHAHL